MSEQKKIAKAGQHPAIFQRYIKAGVHKVQKYQSEEFNDIEQVIMGWEVTDDWLDDEKTQPFWFRPFGVGAINDYDTEKSKKTAYMTGMFPDYTPGVDQPQDYLGKHCIVIVKHNEGKGKNAGRVFANFSGVSAYPDFMPAPEGEASQTPVFFDFYNPTEEAWSQLKPFEQDFVKQAVNYPGSKLAKMLNDDEDDDDGEADF